MSPVAAEVGRSEVKISSARNRSRKKTCEILRHIGNLERAKKLLRTLLGVLLVLRMIGARRGFGR
jgi:hypothetical protein